MVQSFETATRGRRNGSARGALRARTNDVIEDFAELRKDMGKLAEAANAAARSEVKHAGKRLEVLGRDMRSRAGDGFGYLRTRANEGAGYVTEQVRSHPGAAIGASLGAGLVLGFLLSRR